MSCIYNNFLNFSFIPQLIRVPISSIAIPDDLLDTSSDDTINAQQRVISIIEDIIPLNSYYVKSFLKKLIAELETRNLEIDELVYDTYVRLLPAKALAPTDYDIVEYSISKKITKSIKIKETPKLISGLGTTGLRTWEASIYLADFLVNGDYLKSKKIENLSLLELGTGTGLIGLSIYKYLIETSTKIVKNIIMTDGNLSLIETLHTSNLSLNDIAVPRDSLHNNAIRCCKLWWSKDSFPTTDIDIIVGADITYDQTELPDLISCFKQGFQNTNVKEIIIASTIRNENTINEFEKLLSKNEFNYNVIDKRLANTTTNNSLVWLNDNTPEIRIYSITLAI
ncbi:hypothetical protein PACTADRAFT_84181 [Pachysolen tannophilus NRRL Y-2460]|uniref:FAM86 N-terminal domain-containing protein n=1 Tax=Pachysolen tannophilus NRRL Y-2460 TaxID=669874 RepID=A0A1E4TYT4_PACTA|nr:hypothetical protein PACTADRAFT_84181 [Pachysolen tannophilus NRRL Y-2460]